MNDAIEKSSSAGSLRRKPRKLRRPTEQTSMDEDENFSMAAIPKEHATSDDISDDLPSFLQKSNVPESEGDSYGGIDEKEMRRHLMDVESSFLPETTMATTAPDAKTGLDDTYLELADGGAGGRAAGEAQRTPGTVYAIHGEESEPHEGNGPSSSPAAAAAHRTHTRNVSTASATTLKPVRAGAVSIRSISSRSSDHPDSPSAARPASSGSTIRLPTSVPETNQADDLNGTNLFPVSRPSDSSRHVSHHSALSSSTIESDLSANDAAPSNFSSSRGAGSSRAQNLLARLPSLGSMHSFTSGDDASTRSRGVSGTSFLASRRAGKTDDREDQPETPRATHSNFDAPIDTAIARHVQSIQVPETIARDFRARNRSISPEKRPTSSGGLGSAVQDRPRRTLTLKEQNSKIDKLTKENFDLKLKIHFLDQALQNRSEDGVKDLINQNVQFQTDLANERKETQGLRRKMKEMERKMKEHEKALEEAQAQRNKKEEEEDDPTLQAEMHEEILYLRQQLDHTENQVSTLREEMIFKESEKRKMAEHMRGMAAQRGEDTAGVKETMDMWQDLLNAETGRREQAEEDIQKLRDELTALRIERASPAANRMIRPERRPSRLGSAFGPADDEEADFLNGGNAALPESNNILVEQLKHENGELRRDLGAQTSMLTSRNRERERLQQEIEDLKLLARKGDGARSVAGESIFDRSISRAHQREPSRNSDHTGVTQVTEAEREDWERKEGKLRDQNAELRLKFQELERTHSTHLQYVSALEGDFQEMEQELNECQEDLLKIQSERDETLQAYDEKETEFAQLKEEALNEINALDEEKKVLETQLEAALAKQQKTQSRLQNATDGYKGLQGELREITQSVMNLEDEKQANVRTIQTLEQQIAEAEDEIQKWEQKCNEIDQKNRKLEITQESLHSEVTFLREEQESDKIRIGELEDALSAARQTVQDEQERLREIEESMLEERQQRDVLENKSKEEVQKVLDDLNSEHIKIKDEIRRLRRSLSAKEVEGNGWKQRHEDMEQSLRRALGDPQGTKQSMLADIERLLRDLETAVSDLDRAKMDVADKDRLLRHREGLLESTSLESRRLSDLLDKERTSRKHDMDQFEKTSRGQATHMRTIAQQESRMLELETKWTQDKRKLATQEQQFRDQLHERNTLLLAIWNRLSTLCGADWAHNNSLVNGELPSTEVISRHLSGFNKNIIHAVKTVEGLLGSFKTRIRSIEKDLWRDYSTLEHNLDIRVRRMDALERAVIEAQRVIAEEAAQSRPTAPSRTGSTKIVKSTEEITKLKSEVKLLKAELKFHRQHPSATAQQMMTQQSGFSPDHVRRQSTSGSSSKTAQSPARAIVSSLLRHHSNSAVEQLQSQPFIDDQQQQPQHHPIVLASPPVQPSEQRWVHRLKEMERRLKAEREARLLDRRGARQRLEEGRLENEELRQMLEREKERQGNVPEFEGGDEQYEEEVEGAEVAAAEPGMDQTLEELGLSAGGTMETTV